MRFLPNHLPPGSCKKTRPKYMTIEKSPSPLSAVPSQSQNPHPAVSSLPLDPNIRDSLHSHAVLTPQHGTGINHHTSHTPPHLSNSSQHHPYIHQKCARYLYKRLVSQKHLPFPQGEKGPGSESVDLFFSFSGLCVAKCRDALSTSEDPPLSLPLPGPSTPQSPPSMVYFSIHLIDSGRTTNNS